MIADELRAGRRIPGLGHRLYPGEDPASVAARWAAAGPGLPLVEAGGGNQAAHLAECLPERRALGRRLCPGIDQLPGGSG